MNHQKNIKYYTSTDTLFYVGLPILILGAALVVAELLWFYFLPYQMIIGAVLAVIGAGLAFIPRSLRTSEKELDAIVASMTENYAAEIVEKFGLARSLLKQTPPMVVQSYIFEGEGLLFRRGKDDRKWRTSLYSAAAVLCTKNGIVISHKQFSLIEDALSETTHEFHYAALDAVKVEDLDISLPDGSKVKKTRLVFVQNGETALALPAHHVVALDTLAEDICRLIKEAKA